MHSLGIKVLVVFYLCAGGFIGESIRRILQGRRSDIFDYPWFLWTVFGVNAVAITCLVLLRRRAAVEPPMQKLERPLLILVRGLPVTNRVAFLLFTVSYIIGFVVGILFA